MGRNWELVSSYGLDRDWWLEHIRALYADFQAEVLARAGKARWAEKDPTYTLHLPFIEELFPDAVYVHLLRDGHDVVASFRDRWGYRVGGPRRAHRVGPLRQRRPRPGSTPARRTRFLELRYEDLVADPEAQGRRLFEFLGEAWDPAVLDFDPADAQRHRALPVVHRPAARGRRRRGHHLPLARGRRWPLARPVPAHAAAPAQRGPAARARLPR